MKGIGIFLAGLWFIGMGLSTLFGLRFHGMNTAMAVLGLVAGVVMVIQR